MIDFTYATDVLNPNGKVRVITSLELYAQVPDSTGKIYSVPVGMAQNFDIDESRNVVYNFVIGNKNPSRARDLIPGVVDQSTIGIKFVTLYSVNGIGLFTQPNPSSKALAPAVPYNTRPFNLVERWLNPSTGNTLYEIQYTGCYIASCRSSRQMDARDLRIMEDLTVHFKDVELIEAPTFSQDIASGTLGNPFNVTI